MRGGMWRSTMGVSWRIPGGVCRGLKVTIRGWLRGSKVLDGRVRDEVAGGREWDQGCRRGEVWC